MKEATKKITLAFVALVIAATALFLAGCSSQKSEPAPEPANLTGEWATGEGQNYNMNAEITDDTITVKYNLSNNTTALFWVGTYTKPTEAGSFSWTSTADREKLKKSFYGSSDETKEFSYDAETDTLSFPVIWMETETKLEMHRVDK